MSTRNTFAVVRPTIASAASRSRLMPAAMPIAITATP